ncbi:putative secreted protein [Granulibacter bethesdensis]|uniref:Secreted protein n=2 Tax=Granulibacter bethesdensis TaxID=364410 RepID=A0AAC9K9L7_9PROT|nr:putative secreted protein [Granulibacter bethesdensis]APH61759.1 putative secreted protein [Granulibacter bethesdensis]
MMPPCSSQGWRRYLLSDRTPVIGSLAETAAMTRFTTPRQRSYVRVRETGDEHMTAKPPALKRLILLAAGGLMISGCAAKMDARQNQVAAACAKQADEIFTAQNPDAVYSADRYHGGVMDAPYAGIGAPGVITSGLSDSYGHNRNVINCIRRNGGSGQQPVGSLLPSTNMQSNSM